MEFDLWYLVALPALFAAGWLCRGFDRRQRSEKTQLPENFTRGVALLLDDEPDKAIDVLVEVCRLDPDLIELHHMLGKLFRRRGEFERAIRLHLHLVNRSDLSDADRTKALAELAEDYFAAGLFDRSCPVCSPSRASIMSGKYPATVGVTAWIDLSGIYHPARGYLIDAPYIKHLPLTEKTVASALKEQGYDTWHVGKWHLGTEAYYPQHQGFDVNIGGCHMGHPYHGYFSPYQIENLTDGPEGEYLTDRLTTEAIKLIQEQPSDKPFYLNLWHYSVHIPIQAKEEDVAYFEDKARRLGLDRIDPFVEGEFFPVELKCRERVVRRMVQSDTAYAAMIYNLDLNIGRLMDALKNTGRIDNTIIFFTSDNGGLSTSEGSPTCNLPAREGKGWMYEGGVRVPLIAWGPEYIKGSTVCGEPVTSPDFYPTFLEYAIPLVLFFA